MKKGLLALLLAFVLVTFAACRNGGSDVTDPNGSETGTKENTAGETTGFSVGYAMKDITPTEPVPLAGYGNTDQRISEGFLSYLMTTCTAITDEKGTSVLLFANDLIGTKDEVLSDWKKAVSDATGVPESNIIFTGSHTHSGPDLNQEKMAAIARYKDVLLKTFAEVAKEAMEDRSEATMFGTTTEMTGLSFQRHFVLKDGTKWGYSDPDSNPAVDYAGYIDHTLQLVKFVRKDKNPDKKDIILTNWQVHPHRAGGQKVYNMTADIAGIYRDTLAKETDCFVQYITGAAGNTNPTSPISRDNITKDFKEQGKAMAQYAIDAEGTYKELKTGDIKVENFSFTASIDHSMDGMLANAKEVQAFWTKSNDINATKEFGAPYGINSPYHANKIVGISQLPQTQTIGFTVCAVGDFAFACFPGEMFAKGGMMVKEGSPYEMTFFIGYSNGHNGYFPTEDAFEYVGYETDITRFSRGTAEAIANEFVKHLTDLKSK